MTANRDNDREQAIKRLQKIQRPLPANFKFNREEAHKRGFCDR
jgi:hypothetical protein